MRPIEIAAILVTSHALAYWVGHEAMKDKAEQAQRDLKTAQEKINDETVATFHEAIAALDDHFRDNPVRVRVPGRCPEAPGGAYVDPKSVVLVVGGTRRGDRGQAGQGHDVRSEHVAAAPAVGEAAK